MATTAIKKRDISYLNRDFEGHKKRLIEFLRTYYPNDIADFNESSVGMMQVELVSFIGDQMQFYIDKQFQEGFTSTATQAENVFLHGKHLGYRASGKAAAKGTVEGFIKVPAIPVNEQIIPDVRYAGIIKLGAKLKSNSGITYETLIDADFSTVNVNNPDFSTVGDRDSSTNIPLNFVLRLTNIEVKAGETKTATVSVGSYERFREIILSDSDILEILSVTDSDGNTWTEVDFLAQDTVFNKVANTGEDASEVPFVLKLLPVPYRFISEFDIVTRKTKITFGTGDANIFDGELIPDLGDLALPLYGKDTFTDFFLDPQNFLKTRTMGLTPVNTTLTFTYRVGGGLSTNAGSGEVTKVANTVFDIGDSSLSAEVIKSVKNSFQVRNTEPIVGGREDLEIDELKQLIPAFHAAQSRVVTAPDFIVRALSMPTAFGSVFRANARINILNRSAVELTVLSRDVNGYVVPAPRDLKINLKTYLSRFRMLTDAIEILDGEIINIAVMFDVLTEPGFNKQEVVANCIAALKEYFAIQKFQINQPINLSKVNTILSGIAGVLSVINIQVANRVGNFDNRTYSTTVYNITENTQNGIIYCKENAIFECKFLDKDLLGSAR